MARAPYRPKLRTPEFRAAFEFGYPLAFNGIGLALTNQVDRLVVGGMLGMASLGVYSIVLLMVTVPNAMISRWTSTISLSMFHNAARIPARFDARLRWSAVVFPLVFSAYAIAIVTMMNIVSPKVFGPKFEVSKMLLVILGFGAFVRLARGDPLASLLLHAGQTKRLALGNITAIISLVFIVAFIYASPSIDAPYLGRLLGDIISWCATLYLSKDIFRAARGDYAVSVAIGLGAIAAVSLLCLNTSVGTDFGVSVATLACSLLCLAFVAGRMAPQLTRMAFSTP